MLGSRPTLDSMIKGLRSGGLGNSLEDSEGTQKKSPSAERALVDVSGSIILERHC